MALAKASSIDRIVIRKPYNVIRTRTKDTISENGVEISSVFSHSSISPGTIDGSGNWLDTDMSGYSSEIQGIAGVVWTDTIKTKYKEFLEVQVSE
tara:strand:+ start:76 stop:360 length:285 start_codon:yes stop_codon:yes gene_type:complete